MGFIKFISKCCIVFSFLLIAGMTYGQTTVYEEDFDSDDGGWDFPNSTTNGTKQWVNGSISLHSSGASGNYVYSDSPGGSNKYKKNSYILATSPIISTVGFSNLTFQFDVWYNTTGQYNDGMQVQYSFDGTSWNILGDQSNAWWDDWDYKDYIGALGGDGWTGKSGWLTKSINLSTENASFNNNSHVQFRVVFASTNYSKPANDSGVAFDNIKIIPEYCTPININNYNNFFISNVSLGAINKDSNGSTGAYNDFTSNLTNVSRGDDLDGTVSVNISNHNTNTNYLLIWIDFNQDYVFDENDEKFSFPIADSNTTGAVYTIVADVNISIPTDAIIGNTRMRVGFIDGNNYTGYNSCDFVYKAGEVEDYTVNIVDCATNTWEGSSDPTTGSDWNIDANWSCGVVPTITTNVLIPSSPSSGNFPEIYSVDTNGLANDIEIQNGATVTVFDNYIEIDGVLLLNGIIDLSGEGQLIQNDGSTLNPLSEGKIERDQQGVTSAYAYNYWGSPVEKILITSPNTYSSQLKDILYDGDVDLPVKFIGGLNGALGDGSGSGSGSEISIANRWIYKYTKSTNTGGYSDWQYIGSTTDINPGEGFSMKGPDPATTSISVTQNYTFKGLPNNGTISLPVNASNQYLVANPYPSSISILQFILDNTNIDGGYIYFWEQFNVKNHNLASYEGAYWYATGAGSVPGGNVIPSGIDSGTDANDSNRAPAENIPVAQGFFVKADSSTPSGSSFEFNNGQRTFVTEASGDAVFMKNSNAKNSTADIENVDVRMKIRLGFEAPKIKHRQLLLAIDERATDGVDWGFEGEMQYVLEDDMFWDLAEKKYLIQATNNLTDDKEIPLGIVMSETGLATIQIDALKNVNEDVELFIKDKTTLRFYKINEQPFEINLEAGEYLNRFSLIFKLNNNEKVAEEITEEEGEVGGMEIIAATNLSVFMDNNAGELQIRNTTNSEITEVKLFNSLGQLMGAWNQYLDKSYKALPVNVKATGMYIVQLKTTTGVITKKVVIE